jgi:hypothetical protein
MMAGKKHRGQQLLGELCPEIGYKVRFAFLTMKMTIQEASDVKIRCIREITGPLAMMKLKECRAFDL